MSKYFPMHPINLLITKHGTSLALVMVLISLEVYQKHIREGIFVVIHELGQIFIHYAKKAKWSSSAHGGESIQ